MFLVKPPEQNQNQNQGLTSFDFVHGHFRAWRIGDAPELTGVSDPVP